MKLSEGKISFSGWMGTLYK